MRKVTSEPSFPGSTDIGAIKLNAKSRDDISALLIGFQAIYADEGPRTELFRLPEAHILPGCGLDTVRVQHFSNISRSDSSASEDGLQDLGGLFSGGPDFAQDGVRTASP